MSKLTHYLIIAVGFLFISASQCECNNEVNLEMQNENYILVNPTSNHLKVYIGGMESFNSANMTIPANSEIFWTGRQAAILTEMDFADYNEFTIMNELGEIIVSYTKNSPYPSPFFISEWETSDVDGRETDFRYYLQ